MTTVFEPTILAVDPSLNHTGWAVMSKATVHDHGVLRPSRAKGGPDAYRQLYDGVRELLLGHSCGTLVFEVPNRNQRMGEHHRRSADKLMVYAQAVGVIRAAGYAARVDVKAVTVAAWKGNKKKHKTGREVATVFGLRGLTEDECDAVGLGGYFLGVANASKATGLNTDDAAALQRFLRSGRRGR